MISVLQNASGFARLHKRGLKHIAQMENFTNSDVGREVSSHFCWAGRTIFTDFTNGDDAFNYIYGTFKVQVRCKMLTVHQFINFKTSFLKYLKKNVHRKAQKYAGNDKRVLKASGFA